MQKAVNNIHIIMKEKKLINREVSWLSFNERVLQEAADSNVPLVNRMRFLGIFSNNRDEFFKVRVATIKRMLEFEQKASTIIGEDPKWLLNYIQKIVLKQQSKFNQIYDEIIQELANHKIHVINELQLSQVHKEFIRHFFKEKVLPELSPIMLNETHNFPSLKDKSIYLAVKLTKPKKSKKTDYALIEVPTREISRFIILPAVNDDKYIMMLDDIIRYNLDIVFSIFDYTEYLAHTIKFTRDAELDLDNDISQSIVQNISKGVDQRKKGQPVRFIYDKNIPTDLLDYLIDRMQLDNYDHIIQGGRYHNSKDYMDFPNLGGSQLEYSCSPPLPHPDIMDSDDILTITAKKDFLLHCPYHDLEIFIKILRQASIDPRVREINITIYRVTRNSRVMNALINAARNGKKVIAVFELRARFDEESNIFWSKRLSEEGVYVKYGFSDLKVHAKLLFISLYKGKKYEEHAVIGTGNFHEINAKVFSDAFLFTSDSNITKEVKKVFNLFENPLYHHKFKHLILSPQYMRRKLYTLIDNEIKNHKQGKEAFIIFKLNNLVDEQIIKKLYQASNEGVKIKLIIRGTCSLIPGIRGMSENIQVISIIDKYLEHIRALYFCDNGNDMIYLSSADLMRRNLDYRIEVATPIYNESIKEEIKTIIHFQLKDNLKARVIDQKLSNKYKGKRGRAKTVQSQQEIYQYYASKLTSS